MVIKKSSLPAAQSALRELKPRPSDAVSELAAIKNLRRQIERALKIGYSLDEVAKTLAQYDIHLSAAQLESGLAKLRKTDKKKSVPKSQTVDIPQVEASVPKAKKLVTERDDSEPVESPPVASRSSKRAY
jgi:hypothetical protein